MSNLLPFLVMDQLAAARFRDATAGDDNRLEPRLVAEGTQKGKYVLPARVKQDPAHSAHYDAFAVLTEVALDSEIAWPPTPEELAARAAGDQ